MFIKKIVLLSTPVLFLFTGCYTIVYDAEYVPSKDTSVSEKTEYYEDSYYGAYNHYYEIGYQYQIATYSQGTSAGSTKTGNVEKSRTNDGEGSTLRNSDGGRASSDDRGSRTSAGNNNTSSDPGTSYTQGGSSSSTSEGSGGRTSTGSSNNNNSSSVKAPDKVDAPPAQSNSGSQPAPSVRNSDGGRATKKGR